MSSPSPTQTEPTQTEPIILSPSYRLPVALAIAAFPLGALSLWAGVPVFFFAIFLGIQAATLRLHFTATALDLYRGQTQIRTFPYTDWYHWEIYWPAVPILLYFREVNSIHFVPVLFDPKALMQQLNANCPRSKD
jgi:hypothetical protein